MKQSRIELTILVRQGPLMRGTPEWDDRELARMALGNNCISFGAINKPNKHRPKTHDVRYHYMNLKRK